MADRTRPTLIDVLDRVLDKGIVIDASVRISLAGVDLLGLRAKIVVSSFDTYLRLADDPRATELGLVLAPALQAATDGGRKAPRVPLARMSPSRIGRRLGESLEIPPELAEPRPVGDPEAVLERLAAHDGGRPAPALE